MRRRPVQIAHRRITHNAVDEVEEGGRACGQGGGGRSHGSSAYPQLVHFRVPCGGEERAECKLVSRENQTYGREVNLQQHASRSKTTSVDGGIRKVAARGPSLFTPNQKCECFLAWLRKHTPVKVCVCAPTLPIARASSSASRRCGDWLQGRDCRCSQTGLRAPPSDCEMCA